MSNFFNLSIIDEAGELVDPIVDYFRESTQLVTLHLENSFQDAMEMLHRAHFSFPTQLVDIPFDEVDQSELYIPDNLAEPAYGQLVYCGDELVGGYNSDGEYRAIGNLVL